MGRRIEVELTSTREDGTWTWRAAGAKQPKGEIDSSLLYEAAKIGDVVKVEADFHLDGIEITEVFAPKAKKERSNVLEMVSRPLRDDELVTTQRVSRDERRGERGSQRSRKNDGDRGRARGDNRNRGSEARKPKAETAPARPKPKRLRPKRVHRDAMLAEVAEEYRPIVEQVVQDGMPGVRAAIEKQNAEAKEAGKPEIDPTPILAIAEKNLGKARLAEWKDRADAALADAQELDLRDLRSVVASGTDIARDDETRALVEQIRATLDQRVEADHANWLADLDRAVTEERVVRALRLSSRPAKAGAPLPAEIAVKLSEQASAALASDIAQDRWATVLDALAFSPVRGAVTPAGLPAEPNEELLSEVRRLSDRIPTIAALFGIDPATVPKSAKRRGPRRERSSSKGDNRSGNRDDKRRGGRQEGRKPEARKPKVNRPHPGVQPKEEPVSETEQTAPSDDSEVPTAVSEAGEPVAEETSAAEESVSSDQVATPAEA